MIKRLAFMLGALLLLVSGSAAGGRIVLVHVQAPPVPWADSHIFDKLRSGLCKDGTFDVVEVDGNVGGWPPFPADQCSTDSLVNWGQEAGGRYLLVVTVESERIERRKTFSIPLIVGKFQTVGIAEGRYRLIDVYRGKLLRAGPFHVTIDGPRVFQGDMDEERDDPNILLNAVEKIEFINRLEDKLADRIVERFEREVRNR
jgi:hypothetical protein